MLANQLLRTSKVIFKQNSFFTQMSSSCFATNFSSKLNQMRSNRGINVNDNSTYNQLITNAGLNSYIQRVYKTSAISVVGLLSVSQYAIKSGLVYTNPGFCTFGGIVMTLSGLLGTYYTKPTYIQERINGENHIRTSNSPFRIGLYTIGMAGLGLSSSKLFAYASIVNPSILPLSIALTSAIFGGASLYAYTRPKGALLSWGSSLYGAVLGLVGLQLVGLGAQLIMGPNMLSFMLHRADTFLGIGVFSAFIAYDTHVAIQQYQNGVADHLSTSVDLVLDFINILVRLVEVLTMFTSND